MSAWRMDIVGWGVNRFSNQRIAHSVKDFYDTSKGFPKYRGLRTLFLFRSSDCGVQIIVLLSARVVMLLVFHPLYFFFRTRLDYLNSTLALLFELRNPYLLTVLANLTMLPHLPVNRWMFAQKQMANLSILGIEVSPMISKKYPRNFETVQDYPRLS